jgi:phosphonate transport system substrate-binding protein
MADAKDSLRMGLPPTLGVSKDDERLRELTAMLARSHARVTLVLAPSYQELGRQMQLGQLDLAWAPPFVCARLEALGFRVLLRGVRKGASTYRSALVASCDAPGVQSLKGKRAVWVDQDSVSGYLLPMAFLKASGFDLQRDFASQGFAGSFTAAVEQVGKKTADFTAVFAPPARVQWDGAAALEDLAPSLGRSLKVVAFTEEVPSSGLVAAPRARQDAVATVRRALELLESQPGGASLLERLFHIDSFEQAPPMGYRALYRLAVATL